MFKKGDFHLHTTASDGKLSARDLVQRAKSVGLDIMAVTDHDTTASNIEAIEVGKELGVKVIPGIELSTTHNSESIHIIGLFPDDAYLSDSFQDKLNEMKEFRQWRGNQITENLKKYFDISIDYGHMLALADGIVARPHIAQAIIDAGYNYSWDYIFKNLIGNNSPAYVPNKSLSSEEGLAFLRTANAVTIMAHPVLVRKTPVQDLLQFDFDGLEAIYPLNKDVDEARFKRFARDYKKIISAGSDYHGIGDVDTTHGSIGDVSLDEKNINILLKKLFP